MSSTRTGAARAVADLGTGTIIATVEIAAPPERVFRALTAAEEITRWWGAEGVYRTTEWSVDFRAGGQWRAAGKDADGKAFSVGGTILEIEPPRRLVQTWKPDWDAGHETKVTYTLDAVPGGTRVTVRHDGFAGRPESCSGHAAGWEQVLGWLLAHVSPGGGSAERKFFFCRLVPPRPSFASDRNATENEAMQKHVLYWRDLAARGTAVVFGPVADPAGVWGLCVIAVEDGVQVQEILDRDPAILARIGLRYETLPMVKAVVGDAG